MSMPMTSALEVFAPDSKEENKTNSNMKMVRQDLRRRQVYWFISKYGFVSLLVFMIAVTAILQVWEIKISYLWNWMHPKLSIHKIKR